MPGGGYPAGFFPAEQVRAYLSTYRAVSGGAESEQLMIGAFSGTLYPDEGTEYYVYPNSGIHAGGRAYCRVTVGELAIQTNTWEAMQRLVDALNDSIEAAKAAEAKAAEAA